jgi:hypothetical protein
MSAEWSWERTAGRAREDAAMGRERTFGARWPVADPGLTQRDMKRGPIAGPDHHRDSKESER